MRVEGGIWSVPSLNGARGDALISQKVFIKSFFKSQFPHKSVKLSFIITNMKNKLTNLRGNRLLQNDMTNDFCEIRPRPLCVDDLFELAWLVGCG